MLGARRSARHDVKQQEQAKKRMVDVHDRGAGMVPPVEACLHLAVVFPPLRDGLCCSPRLPHKGRPRLTDEGTQVAVPAASSRAGAARYPLCPRLAKGRISHLSHCVWPSHGHGSEFFRGAFLKPKAKTLFKTKANVQEFFAVVFSRVAKRGGPTLNQHQPAGAGTRGV